MKENALRTSTAVILLLLAGCTLGYEAHTRSEGLAASELACAHRFFIGEGPHLGMPHMLQEAEDIAATKRELRRALPNIELVEDASKAEFIVSVLMVPAHVCTPCDNRPDTEWHAIVERGGASHRREYSPIGPFLELSGRVNEGSSASRGFVRQLAGLLACSRSGG